VTSLKRGYLALALAVVVAAAVFAANPTAIQASSGDITEFAVPTAMSGPNAITDGPDGNLWFTEQRSNQIGRLTPSGVITEFAIPTAGGNPSAITTGSDGNLWFTEVTTTGIDDNIGRLTPAGVFTAFSVPNSVPTGITSGPDGNLWFTENNTDKIGVMTTAGALTEYSVPTSGSGLSGITAGPDGNLWFVEGDSNKIGVVTPAGAITEYTIPTASSFTQEITSGPDGNLWFAEFNGNKIGKITPAGAITEYPTPTGVSPLGISSGADGNVWFTESAGNRIGSMTQAGAVTEYSIATAGSNPNGIATGPDGNVWFTESSANNIGRLQLPLPSVAVALPAMANAAYGGYTTVTEIQNVGSGPAGVLVRYFDSGGAAVGSGDGTANLPVNGTWTVRQDNGHGLAAGQAGSAVVYSNQPLASFANEFAPGGGDATSYTGIIPSVGSGTALYAPAIANNAYGGYTTGIGLVNVSAASADITVTYRDGSGSIVQAQTLSGVAAGAYQGLYSGAASLPNGFAGTATITSSAGALAAVVNETGPGGQFSSYDAVPAGSSALFAPAALRNAFGGYNTGMGIQNTTGTAGTVTINYYDSTGTATMTTWPIAANGYLGVYQGTDIAADGAYTAKITASIAIAAIVNEVALSTTSAQQSTAYNTFASGSATLHLPLVESAGSDGWSTGEGIMNTGSTATTVTVTYYDTASGAAVGTPQSQSLQSNAFWGLYQPAGGLPNGVRASAVVTTSGGQVAVICNESNATSFMSYGGQ
jgi:streptogramin lyase